MDFQSEKSFGKLRLRAFQPYHQILCMSKHVEDVEDYLTFDIALISCINLSQHLQHQTICIDTRPLMYTQQIR